jgi:hypothetical protein
VQGRFYAIQRHGHNFCAADEDTPEQYGLPGYKSADGLKGHVTAAGLRSVEKGRAPTHNVAVMDTLVDLNRLVTTYLPTVEEWLRIAVKVCRHFWFLHSL